jgi:hypothetical protein
LPFELFPLKKFYLAQLPISLLAHWFLGSSTFLAPCIFWLSVLCFMYSYKYFLPQCGGLFSLETISFVVQKLFNFM